MAAILPGDLVASGLTLWRRIHREQYVLDGGAMRISSAAFKDPELSADVAEMLREIGVDHTFTKAEGVGVAAFPVDLALALGQQVTHDPIEVNPAHSVVAGHKPGSVAKRFARESTFLA